MISVAPSTRDVADPGFPKVLDSDCAFKCKLSKILACSNIQTGRCVVAEIRPGVSAFFAVAGVNGLGAGEGRANDSRRSYSFSTSKKLCEAFLRIGSSFTTQDVHDREKLVVVTHGTDREPSFDHWPIHPNA